MFSGLTVSSFPLLLSVISSLCFLSHATATDTLKPGQSISTVDGSTLVSGNGVFELGFFSPGNSSNRYVAIWYHDISPKTTLWIANREIPILPSLSASLILTDSGNLVLLASSANGNGNFGFL
jgi:hypothetical protein